MAEVEIGAFIALNAIAFSGWFLTAKWGWGVMLILSFVVFGGLSLFMFAELQVVQTTTTLDQNGNVVSSEKAAYIDSQQNTFGWVYFILAGLSMAWFVKIIIAMFKRRNIVNASGYY